MPDGLTLEEKVSLMTGLDTWCVHGVERVGIASLKMSDGPSGARGDSLFREGTRALAVPCGAALGATWNPALVEQLGAALGEETRARGASVLLAPTLNLHRSPLAGRNFECYSEDPLLTARLGVAMVRGIQSRRVAATAKHFVANDSEFERNTIDSVVSERALREIYLLPFEAVVKDGRAWAVMGAYNQLNGEFCCENGRLLQTILRDEWGFDGVTMTDWYAARSTAPMIAAGIDIEMPGPGRFYGQRLVDAVRAGEVDETLVDAAVARYRRLLDRTDRLANEEPNEEHSLDDPEHVALARHAAAEAAVLLRNDGTLPFDLRTLSSLAVIGPNADRVQINGGGSASLTPQHRTSPLTALRRRLGDSVDVRYAPGCDTDRTVPPMDARFDVEIFDGPDWAGAPVSSHQLGGRMIFDHVPEGVTGDQFSFRATGRYVPATSGPHTITLIQLGRARLSVGGHVVLDGFRDPPPRGDAFFGQGSEEVAATVELTAATPVDVVLEYAAQQGDVLRGAQVGCRRPIPADSIDEAAALAASAEAVVLVVGTNDDWETEGRDRESMDLPGEQDELIRRVAAANPRTVVVLNAGSPVTMDWAEDVPAILVVWFGGQEMADALVDVLTGDVNPSGKLPTTFPVRLRDNPAYLDYPGENGKAVYGEGIFVGYRYYEARGVAPKFPFGHGLSYTSFAYESAALGAAAIGIGDDVDLSVVVANTGDRTGAEVVQCYVAPLRPRMARPPKELKAFAKVMLEPGERRELTLHLPSRSFAYYDPGDATWEQRRLSVPVATGSTSEHRSEPGWYVDPGRYEIHVGGSSAEIAHVLPLIIA